MQHVFIIGSRGLPAKYGGFETFVEQLVSNQMSSQVKYHVACLSDAKAYEHFEYMPQEGDSFIADNLQVTVLKMDGLRVEKVLVRVLQETEETTEQ